MKTTTRSDIAEKIYEEVGISRKDAGDILDMMVGEIRDELVKGNDVKLSTFGSFLVKNKTPRIGRNPKTGVEAVITARRVISFKPSQNLRKALNK
ncbi:MAG TPA: integration host factor subunit alpha [Alphaproteobacteria bacterium]|nr:integration host factor subunit alpha [Alphaproteobacteria bacterium]